MSSASLLHALRPVQRGNIATLITQLEKNSINPSDIWQKIQDLKISPNDYNDPEFKRLNAIAIDKLNSAGLTVNGKSIPSSTILAKLSEQPVSKKDFFALEEPVVVEEPVVPGEPGRRRYEEEPGRINPLKPYQPTIASGYKPGFSQGTGTQTQQDIGQANKDEEKNIYSQGVVKLEEEPVSSKLTLQEALKELKGIDDRVNALTIASLKSLPDLYKDFYALQNTYFGLSGAVVQGRLWWKKETENDQKAFAEASAKTFKALRDKDVELQGETTVKLTPEEAKAFIEEVNANNPIEALRKKLITKDQFNDILRVRNEIFTWKKLRQKSMVLPSDKDKILKAVTLVKSLQPYAGEFSLKLANELEKYVQSDPTFKKEESLLGGLLGQEKSLLEMISTLNVSIQRLMSQTKNMPNVSWFKSEYQKIMTLFDSMPTAQKTAQLKKEVIKPLYLITEYRDVVAFERVDLLNTLTKTKKENADITQVSSKIDKITDYLAAIDDQYQKFAKELERNPLETVAIDDLNQFKNNVLMVQSKEEVQNIVFELCNSFGAKVTSIYLGILKGEYPDEIGFTQFAQKYEIGNNKMRALDKSFSNDLFKKRFDSLLEASVNVLKNAIIQYRDSHELPKLHLIATGASSDISNAIEKMKNAKLVSDKSLNFIINAARELDRHMTNKDREEVATLLFTNFAYILAAFDSFRYALFTEGIKADAPKTWLEWFSSFFKSGAQKQAFSKLNTIVDVFMESIVNTITIHQELFQSLRSIMSGNKSYSEFNSGSVGGQLSLNTYFNAQKISGFSKADGQYKYAYTLPAGNKIKFPGKVEIIGSIGAGTEANKLTDMHKKSMSYVALLDLDKQIIGLAYNNAEWQKRLVKTFEYQKLQDIVNLHMQTLDALKTQVAQLKASEKSAATFTRIAELEGKIKEEITTYEGKRDAQQKAYEEAYAEYIATVPGYKEIVVTKQ